MPSRRPIMLSLETNPSRLDCRWCGACCVNTSENRQNDCPDYVAVTPDDVISRHPTLLSRHTVQTADGHRYMELTPEGTCTALQGRIGRRVHCTIYDHRPSGCREVEAGSEECLARRHDAEL